MTKTHCLTVDNERTMNESKHNYKNQNQNGWACEFKVPI